MQLNTKELDNVMKVMLLDRKELATRLGVSATTVGNWLRGKVQPRMKNVRAISETLKINPKNLLKGDKK